MLTFLGLSIVAKMYDVQSSSVWFTEGEKLSTIFHKVFT